MTANLESLVAEAQVIVDEAVARMEREIGRELEDDEYDALVDDVLSELDDEDEPELFRYAATFNPNDHPRGQPTNAGQFAEKPGGEDVKEQEHPEQRAPGKYKIKKHRVDQGAINLMTKQFNIKGVETPEQFAQFFGVQDDQDMDSVEVWCQGPLMKNLAFIAKGPWGAAHHSMWKEPNGEVVQMINWMTIKDQGTGAATKMVVSQVRNAINASVKRIVLDAAGSAETEHWFAKNNATKKDGEKKDVPMIGYRVWPKHGWDGPLPVREEGYDGPHTFLDAMPDHLRNAQSVLDLFSMPGGEEWWRKNGVEFYGTFDLTPGSRSRKFLTAYVMKAMKRLYGEGSEPIKFQR